jgi:hypothetical protein
MLNITHINPLNVHFIEQFTVREHSRKVNV